MRPHTLSYGGILRVVRTDGSTLKNATSGTAVKIKSYEDYENNRKDDTSWQFAARNPGRWANSLKVCSIDNAADQIISIASTADFLLVWESPNQWLEEARQV